jgi:hypothetical protein
LTRRVCYWIGYTLIMGGVIPLTVAFLFAGQAAQEAPALTAIFGTGEAYLVVIAWIAVGIAELRDAPEARKVAAGFCQWTSFVFLLLTALSYGYTHGRVASPESSQAVTVSSLIALCVSGILSTLAVAVGTPE